jgi:hypothetical protein
LVEAIYAQTKDRCKDGCQKQRRFVESDAVHVLKEWFSNTFKNENQYQCQSYRAHPTYPSSMLCYEAKVTFPAGVGMPTSVLGNMQSSPAAAENSACYKALTCLLEAGKLPADTSGPIFLAIEMEREKARAEDESESASTQIYVNMPDDSSVASSSLSSSGSYPTPTALASSPVLTAAPRSPSALGSPGGIWSNPIGELKEMFDQNKIKSATYSEARQNTSEATFSVVCTVITLAGLEVKGLGNAKTKKQAKTDAALGALRSI